MGPMRAAARFARELAERGVLEQVEKVRVYLYGSLALTGVGHGTPGAVVYGLLGLDAEKMEMSATPAIATLATEGKLLLNGTHPITFSAMQDVVLEKETTLPEHANGMRFCAIGQGANCCMRNTSSPLAVALSAAAMKWRNCRSLRRWCRIPLIPVRSCCAIASMRI